MGGESVPKPLSLNEGLMDFGWSNFLTFRIGSDTDHGSALALAYFGESGDEELVSVTLLESRQSVA